MGTLANLIAQLPYRLQKRYGGDSNSVFVNWANDALRELEREGHLPEVNRECGVSVENNVWITPPSDFRRGLELNNPEDPQIVYSFIELCGDSGSPKLKLTERLTFSEDEDPIAISAFSAQATASINVNVTGIGGDDWDNYLLKITSGTIAPKSYRIVANDATSGPTTKIYFLHDLTTALSPAQATAGLLISKNFYLILRYVGTYTQMTSDADEIPVGDKFEPALKAYLHWKAYEWVRVLVNETKYWEEQWKSELNKFAKEKNRVGRNKQTRGRRLAGFEQSIYSRCRLTSSERE